MRLLLTFLSLIGVAANAQNFAVKLYGTNPVGIPTNWPSQIQPIGTNTSVSAPFVLMSQAVKDNVIATNQPAYNAWASNALFSATSGSLSNYLAWSNLFVALPLGMADSYTRSNTMWVAWQSNIVIAASINAGTNSAAQDHARLVGLTQNISTQSQTIWIDQQYLHQILNYLSRLGPGLQQIYKSDNDPVGH